MIRFIPIFVLCNIAAAAPVLAQEAQPAPCGIFCKVWRNVSGKVQRPVSTASWDDGSMHVPTAEEEARIPRAADLVVVHGDLLRKSRAERQREEARVGEEIKRIEALRGDGAETSPSRHEPGRPKLGQAD